jgi:GNAT superfamily N-acetyltransferase
MEVVSLKYVSTNGNNSDFIELCKMLDNNLDELVGGNIQRKQYEKYNTLEDIKDVIVVYENETPVGCGSYKYYSENVAEVKRVFVKKEYRGQKIAKKIMIKLEEDAKGKGYKKFILETGKILKGANGLYKSLSYNVIENYGQYKEMNESVCMEKIIDLDNNND